MIHPHYLKYASGYVPGQFAHGALHPLQPEFVAPQGIWNSFTNLLGANRPSLSPHLGPTHGTHEQAADRKTVLETLGGTIGGAITGGLGTLFSGGNPAVGAVAAVPGAMTGTLAGGKLANRLPAPVYDGRRFKAFSADPFTSAPAWVVPAPNMPAYPSLTGYLHQPAFDTQGVLNNVFTAHLGHFIQQLAPHIESYIVQKVHEHLSGLAQSAGLAPQSAYPYQPLY